MGLNASAVTHLGGLKAALDFLGERRLPAGDEVLVVRRLGDDPSTIRSTLMLIWEAADHPGYFHMAGLDPNTDGENIWLTSRPISGSPIRMGNGENLHPVWFALSRDFGLPERRWSSHTVPTGRFKRYSCTTGTSPVSTPMWQRSAKGDTLRGADRDLRAADRLTGGQGNHAQTRIEIGETIWQHADASRAPLP